MKVILGLLIIFLVSTLLITSCRPKQTIDVSKDTKTEELRSPNVPEWHKNAVLYEVNLRHYTSENTFKSFEAQVPRLKEMGIDILWFMPIFPISKEKRKGPLGSPYSVADYFNTNPDYGTIDDFKHLVEVIHQAGMHVILDWVPNHTGWDNPWIKEHADWYTKDKNGNITDPMDPNTGKSWGWTDVADLNYDNAEMRLKMIDALKFWVVETNIDGYRMDVAPAVPSDFWIQATDSLYAIRPLFMLSEGENPELVNNGSFIADYAWEMHHTFNEIAASQGASRIKRANVVQGNLKEGEAEVHIKTATDIDTVLAKKRKQYTQGYQMQFTSNHDENSWSDTEFARLGEAHKTFAVLAATMEGIPLIYTGQESAMDKKLEFFKKDSITWGEYIYAPFYKTLFDLKHRNKALWNGTHGGQMKKVTTGNDQNVYAFCREKDGDKVVVILNLSAEKQSATLGSEILAGQYNNVFSGTNKVLNAGTNIEVNPWEYMVYSNR